MYAIERLAAVAEPGDLDTLDRIRRTRNLTEYGAQPASVRQVEADLAVASRLTQAIIVTLTRRKDGR